MKVKANFEQKDGKNVAAKLNVSEQACTGGLSGPADGAAQSFVPIFDSVGSSAK